LKKAAIPAHIWSISNSNKVPKGEKNPMNTFKARGLVLREYETGESDKRLALLCKGHGRLLVHARGARGAKSKFLAASQMFTYGDYVIADGRQFLSLNQGSVIESFYPIRQDYDKLCYAQYILEICEKTIPDRTPCDELLLLVLKTLQHISRQNAPSLSVETDKLSAAERTDEAGDVKISGQQAVSVFLFRFFLFYGLAPEMNVCCLCGEGLDHSATLFCDEGMVCFNCQKHRPAAPNGTAKSRMPLSLGAQEAVRHILSTDVNQAFMFRAKDSVLAELTRAARLCWMGHFPITLQTDIQMI